MGFNPLELVRRGIEIRKRKADLTASLSLEEKKIRHGQKFFVFDNFSAYLIGFICAGSYLAGLLNYVGLPNELSGIVLAIPVLAGVFQLIGAMASQGLDRQKGFVVTGLFIHRFFLSVIFFYPLIFGSGRLTSFLMVATYGLGYFAGTAVGPSSANWLVNLVPFSKRAGYFSYRERLSFIFIAIATLGASLILDSAKSNSVLPWGFAAIGLFIMIFTLATTLNMLKVYEPHSGLTKKRSKIKDLWEPVKDSDFRRVIWVYIIWQIATQISVPFLGIYYIDDIGISYSLIGVVAFVIILERALVIGVWGRYAEKTTWENVLKIAILFFSLGHALLIFLGTGNHLWMYPLAQLVLGISYSILNVAFLNFQYGHLKSEAATIYIGVCAAVSGIFGFLSAFSGSFILKSVENIFPEIAGQRILLLISVILGVGLTLYIHLSFREDKAGKSGTDEL